MSTDFEGAKRSSEKQILKIIPNENLSWIMPES